MIKSRRDVKPRQFCDVPSHHIGNDNLIVYNHNFVHAETPPSPAGLCGSIIARRAALVNHFFCANRKIAPGVYQ